MSAADGLGRYHRAVAEHVHDALAGLIRSVLETPGETSPTVRSAAFAGDTLSEPIGSYVSKVREGSHRVTDRDIIGLRSAGYSEDAIFEITLAAAVGAAKRRLDVALGLLQRTS